MKAKKSKTANLERLRFTFLLIGLVTASSLVLSAFEWRTFAEERIVSDDEVLINTLPDEVILAYVPPKEEAKPKPKVMQRPVVDDFVYSDDNRKIDIPLVIPDWDIDEPTVIEIPVQKEKVDEPDFFMVVEKMPEYPGGIDAMYEFIGSKIKYPEMAKDAGIKGKVHLVFMVDKNGDISDLKIERGIGGGCDEEAIRVMKLMPKWSPGKQRGRAVNVQYRMAINYSLK
jgi:protein TonB